VGEEVFGGRAKPNQASPVASEEIRSAMAENHTTWQFDVYATANETFRRFSNDEEIYVFSYTYSAAH